MKTELAEAMTSGLFVEFQDAAGNILGQTLFTDWRGRPVPGVGDMLASEVRPPAGGDARKLLGRVVKRQFELQQEIDGTPCVWVRITVQTRKSVRRRTSRASAISFSPN